MRITIFCATRSTRISIMQRNIRFDIPTTASFLGATASLGTAAHAHAASPAASEADLAPVTVSGLRPLLHDKLAGDLQSTPQSVTVVTSALMSSQADNRLEDALRTVPGI